MAIFHLTSLSPLLLLLLLVHQIVAQAMTPNPVFDCTNPNYQVVYTACKAHDYSRCCALGSSCCAGGCCDLESSCLNVGTSNEVCCPVTDPNFCGYYVGSGVTPPYAVQSIVCTGSSGLSSYFCPPGATCDSADDSCIGGSSGDGSGGGSSVSSTAVATSSVPEPTPVSTSDESTSLETSTTAAETDTPTSSSMTSTDTASQAATVTVTSSSSSSTGAASHNDAIGASVDVFSMWAIVQVFLAGIL